jgi:DNA recombination protein RmuC
MPEVLLYIITVLSLVSSGLLVILLVRRPPRDSAGALLTPADLDARVARLDVVMRDEAERSRRQSSTDSAALRQEVLSSVTQLSQSLTTSQSASRDALAAAHEGLSSAIRTTLSESAARSDALRVAVELKLDAISATTQSASQKLTEDLTAFREALLQNLLKFSTDQNSRFTDAGQKDDGRSQLLRSELLKLHDTLSGTLLQRIAQLNADTTAAWQGFGQQLAALATTQSQSMDQLRTTVDASLNNIRQDNEARLEKMRQTVDEKLQSTLETRLGEKFGEVRETLERLNTQLVEVKRVDASVKDLTKVLGNVKTRGIWGEIQLGALLEQMLSPDQYATNVATASRNERVEYAIKFPGEGDGDGGAAEFIWLPIDAKFPIEDYQRLVAASEAADPELVAAAGKALENRIWSCARDICTKYIKVPGTTNFAVLYLPIEGLYAEVVRRVGLVEELQRDCRVMVAGPTTLAALLNSLQMGFRTLAIRKRTGEIEKLLGAVKTQFEKYTDLVAAVRRNLDQASSNLDGLSDRARQINKKLTKVEKLSDNEAELQLPAPTRLLEDELTDAETT